LLKKERGFAENLLKRALVKSGMIIERAARFSEFSARFAIVKLVRTYPFFSCKGKVCDGNAPAE
jgi:hypothetical protein